MDKPKVVVILGPTASGKTSLSIKIAEQFNGEIISVDSRTIYREMNIGTAKPEGRRITVLEITPEDVEEKGIHKAREVQMEKLFEEKPFMVEGIPHWAIDIVDPDQDFTVAQFKRYADKKIRDIIKRGKLPILAGGTGLYISAVVDNLTFTEVPPNEGLRTELEQLSNEELLKRLEETDWTTADTIDTSNRRRVIRALEVIKTTGKPMSEQQKKGELQYNVLQIGIEIERETLYERIEERVDVMVAEGLADEVRDLKAKYGCGINSMTGIGYRQICAFLSGYMKLSDAIEILKRDTRHYAKRQLTWFKRDSRIKWTSSIDQALKWVKEFKKN